ncbi:hypothetical protein HS088_TW09G00305 [Tripterygium wilfordii]|uniref:Fiber protein Fb34 n=1 Tax=Tripterygium wilfordii TaxID=458696 RepID=A0A7J7D7I2_TRIWF|nr:uncharacterized protein LOC120005460 [Tripterygium wilfordii]XP_038711024.1 uncharacterized protein LOC120005460 [Tripterygium wilfordii]KAF5742261.1 hypothetical protein HS088_TW09G00305 [Tripterygium wilfordii]
MASVLLLIAVFLLDLIAFGLAVAAEQRRNTAVVLKEADYSYCQYDSDIATGLGAGSFVLLLASQALIMVASRCLCCGRALRPGGSRAWAVFLFIFCWVFFFIAEVCLLAGSVTNAHHTKYRNRISDTISCETLRKGVFGAGAAFIVLTGIVSELYYASYSKAHDGQIPYGRDAGVRMQNL